MLPLMLICSHDVEFCLMLQHIFKTDGFETGMAETVEEAVQRVESGDVSVVILDCQPGSSLARAICTQIKSSKTAGGVPIVAFVMPGCGNRYLELLKAGVDQAFARPIAPELYLAYLRSIVPSHQGEKSEREDGDIISFGKIKILIHKYRVKRGDGRDIHLSPIEFRLLRKMSSLPGQVFSREELIRAAWPGNIFVELRTVDVHIGRLRRLLVQELGTDLIRTVRSAGYAMEVAA
jgi:two-component system phosphate regulon response regulator PhoB